MMVYFVEFDKEALCKKIRLLDDDQRLAYSILIAERFWQNYQPFHRQQSWGNPSLLRKAIDLAWTSFFDLELAIDLGELIERLDKITPDSEDFAGKNAELAISAAIVVTYLIYFLQTRDAENICHQAQAAFEAVDNYAGWDLWEDRGVILTPEMEQQLRDHPLVQQELRRQVDDLELVGSLELGTIDIVEKLKVERANLSESCLGLS
jgi:uncharacterized protein